MPTPGTPEWLSSVQEDIIDPEQRIIDPHHHLWKLPNNHYLLENLWEDTGSGHNVKKTVFVECHAEYRTSGPEHLKCLGETEFVTSQAEQSQSDSSRSEIAGIVAHADLILGDAVEEVLVQHEEIAKGRFRGIRDAGAHAEFPDALMIAGRAPAGLYGKAEFRKGMKRLGSMGYTFDTWHYHYQNQEFFDLAKACPDTQMILDHFGTPLGVGPYEAQRQQILSQWKKDIKAIASCDNVVAKIGGLAMPDNGFGWHERDTPPTSDEFVEAQREFYLYTIECFGVERCMFESNFPVDKFSISYPVLYNGLKKIVADFSDSEKDTLFYGTAERIYRL